MLQPTKPFRSDKYRSTNRSFVAIKTVLPLQRALLLFGFWLSAGLCSALAFTPPQSTDTPASVSLHGKEIPLAQRVNPLRQDATHLPQFVLEGRTLYFKNCVLCHGALLDGKGLFGDRFNPPPADFLETQNGILKKSEAYAFWRIAKGGKGLPDKFEPWNSAMPAWENTLSDNEIWKVVLFIFDTASPSTPSAAVAPNPDRGREVYLDKCAVCHGDTGNGKGITETFSHPKPRNFTKGQFKIRSTPFGKIPTDDDLFNVITRGMPGTIMPGWAHLPESDRTSLVLYIKTLSKAFEKALEKGKPPEPVIVPELPPLTIKSIKNGKDLFLANCSGCHGQEGRSDGEATKRVVSLTSDALWPRNLTKPWYFRRGDTRSDLFTTIRTGLSGTAMPSFSAKTLTDEQVWDVVHFVQTLSLSQKPPMKVEMLATRLNRPLPAKPDDVVWKTVDSYTIPLGGQVAEAEKLYYPMIDSIRVKTVYNADEIAFHLGWDDPTPDPGLAKSFRVAKSPPPPLPPELREHTEPDADDEPETEEFPDVIALQFPLSERERGSLPHFLNGDADHPVVLLQWQSNPQGVKGIMARGLQNPPLNKNAGNLQSQGLYKFGQYQVVIKRPRVTVDKTNDAQFELGKSIPIAFQAQDGKEKEAGTKKSVSSWYRLTLGP
jgi:mono/diheme cytochrome c family protein